MTRVVCNSFNITRNEHAQNTRGKNKDPDNIGFVNSGAHFAYFVAWRAANAIFSHFPFIEITNACWRART